MHPPISRHGCGQNEHIIQLVISPQSAIGGDHRAAESGHQVPVEIEPQRAPIPFHPPSLPWLPRSICDKALKTAILSGEYPVMITVERAITAARRAIVRWHAMTVTCSRQNPSSDKRASA